MSWVQNVRAFIFICNKLYNECHFSGPKERWKCAICFDKYLPPGNMGLHYEKYHASYSFPSEAVSKMGSKTAEPVFKPQVKKQTRSRKRQAKPKTTPNFWPCSICGNSFSNYIRYQKHLKELHDLNDSDMIQDSAAIRNIVESNEFVKPQVMDEEWEDFWDNLRTIWDLLCFSTENDLNFLAQHAEKFLHRWWQCERMRKLTWTSNISVIFVDRRFESKRTLLLMYKKFTWSWKSK